MRTALAWLTCFCFAAFAQAAETVLVPDVPGTMMLFKTRPPHEKGEETQKWLKTARILKPGQELNVEPENYLRYERGSHSKNVGDAELKALAAVTAWNELDLSYCRISDAGIAHLVGLTRLEVLSVNDCDSLTSACIAQLKVHKRLTTLKLGGIALDDSSLKQVAELDSLQSLSLCACLKVTDDGVASLAASKSLRTLDLSHCIGVQGLGISGLSQITTLLTAGTCVTETWLKSIGKLHSLIELELTSASKVNDAGLVQLKGLKKLQNLNLSYSREVTDVGLAALAELVELTELNLEALKKVTDIGVRHLKNLTKLRVLNLRQCTLTDDGVKHLAELGALQVIDLRCRQVTGAGLLQLKTLKSLRKLTVTSQIPLESQAELKKDLPDLEIVQGS